MSCNLGFSWPFPKAKEVNLSCFPEYFIILFNLLSTNWFFFWKNGILWTERLADQEDIISWKLSLEPNWWCFNFKSAVVLLIYATRMLMKDFISYILPQLIIKISKKCEVVEYLPIALSEPNLKWSRTGHITKHVPKRMKIADFSRFWKKNLEENSNQLFWKLWAGIIPWLWRFFWFIIQCYLLAPCAMVGFWSSQEAL